MREGAEDDLAGINAEIGGITGNTSEDRYIILSLQKQISEANLAREQQVHETRLIYYYVTANFFCHFF